MAPTLPTEAEIPELLDRAAAEGGWIAQLALLASESMAHADRLGNGDELRTANNLLDLALREKRAADAQVNALRAQLAGAESRVATLVGQLDGAQGELRSMRARLATAQLEIENASKRAELAQGPSPESRRFISAMAVLAGDSELLPDDLDDATYFAAVQS